jgi:hypothetical protein
LLISNRFVSLAGFIALTSVAGCVSRVEFPPPVKLLGPFVDQTSNLAGILGSDPACGDVLAFAVRPDQDELVAGVPSHGLYHQVGGATTWQPLGQGSGSAVIDHDPYSIVFDPGNPGTFWETGIHNNHGIFQTRDSGDTFQYVVGTQGNDLISVDFADPARKVWFAGNHEIGVHAQVSMDSGATWRDIAASLPSTAGDTSWPLILNATTWLLGSNNGTSPGIFRTIDGGATWEQVSRTPVHSHPLRASDGTIYWMAEELKGVVSSTDDGVTWSPPMAPGITLALVPGLVELPSGRLLAMGKQYLLISADKAKTWTPIAEPPLDPFGVAYSVARKSIYLWYNNNCLTRTSTQVLPGAVVSLSFDDQTQ